MNYETFKTAHPEVAEFLTKNDWSAFYRSLLDQATRRGALSPKQLACVEKAIQKEKDRKAAALLPRPPRTYSISPGEKISIKGWLAGKLKAQLGLEFFLRNLEVVEVLGETAKAFNVKVKFVSTICASCHVCGRELDNAVSRATGIGPVCAKKIGLPRPNLETAHETLRDLEALALKIGTVGPVWLPKSQIVSSVFEDPEVRLAESESGLTVVAGEIPGLAKAVELHSDEPGHAEEEGHVDFYSELEKEVV